MTILPELGFLGHGEDVISTAREETFLALWSRFLDEAFPKSVENLRYQYETDEKCGVQLTLLLFLTRRSLW